MTIDTYNQLVEKIEILHKQKLELINNVYKIVENYNIKIEEDIEDFDKLKKSILTSKLFYELKMTDINNKIKDIFLQFNILDEQHEIKNSLLYKFYYLYESIENENFEKALDIKNEILNKY